MERNLTTGSVLKTVVYFSLPYLLSYFLQTLYGMADLFIIGQFNGVESTTAVSIGSQVMHMLTVMIIGLAMGGTVMIGQAVGARSRERTSQAIGNTLTLFMVLSVVLMAVLLMAVRAIVNVMSTPAEAVSGAVQYLTICFIGIPFITAYNIISSIFRGMGDSKSPMYFVAVACAANIVLDYVFIGGLGMGAAGAALGTTLSQAISVIVACTVIIRRDTGIHLQTANFKPDASTMKSLLRIGVPVAVQDGFIQVSFIVITIFANQRGLTDAAAVGIVEKIIGIIFLVPSSMSSTVSALSAQNIGAGRRDRARKVLRYAATIAVVWGLFASVVMQFAAEALIGLFTSDAAVIVAGGQYIRSYVFDCLFAGIHFSFSGYFCACEMSLVSFVHNSISIICARIPLAWVATHYFRDTLYPMGLASTVGSIVSVVICVLVYVHTEKKRAEG